MSSETKGNQMRINAKEGRISRRKENRPELHELKGQDETELTTGFENEILSNSHLHRVVKTEACPESL